MTDVGPIKLERAWEKYFLGRPAMPGPLGIDFPETAMNRPASMESTPPRKQAQERKRRASG
jgi:hypothetical protein